MSDSRLLAPAASIRLKALLRTSVSVVIEDLVIRRLHSVVKWRCF